MFNILLNKKKNVNSTNVDNSLLVELSTSTSLLPANSVATTLNTYEVYLNERNSTKKYKMIFTLYPYMTNVLYNKFTEIVYNEGGEDCFVLSDKPLQKDGPWIYNSMRTIAQTSEFGANAVDKGLTRYEAIRDTEYSHQDIGNFTYHCGVDIFNNHYLRSDGFFNIKKTETNDKVVNTIADNVIYSDGSVAKYQKPSIENENAKNTEVNLHLFNHTNLLSFKDAYIQNLKEEFGWFGFINKGYSNNMNHKTIGGKDILVNRCINNKNICDFIDLYPDRKLFSFLPILNTNFKNRIEYNWDWCITYPFKKEYKKNEDGDYKFFRMGCGLTCEIRKDMTPQDAQFVYMRTYCNHGLKEGDSIKVTHIKNGDKLSFTTQIYGLGDVNDNMKNYYFTILYEDLIEEFGEKVENELYISKLVNNVPCDYYIRKFKKINNLKSSLNKAGFAKTIYNDEVSQIIFSDDIDITNLKNHLGMEVDEVFLTLIKRNKGYREWYQGFTNPELIEFSHCFGEVTSGFNFEKSKDEEVGNEWENCPNIRLNKEKHLDRDIKLYEAEQMFYGDFVEFSPSTMNENILEDVYFRFNTSQRELEIDDCNLYWDELVHDDNDFSEGNEGQDTFKVEKKIFLSNNANLNKEGYIYKSHYRVKLKEYDNVVLSKYDTNLHAQNINENGDKIASNGLFLEYRFKSNIPYNLNENDKLIIFYDENDYIEGVVSNKTQGSNVIFNTEKTINNRFRPKKIFFKNPEIPEFSYYIADGSGKHIWKNPILESELPQTSEIYGRAFANGSVYVNTKIDFFLRRQDPQECYLQYWYEDGNKVNDIFTMSPLTQNIPDVDYKVKTNYSVCER